MQRVAVGFGRVALMGVVEEVGGHLVGEEGLEKIAASMPRQDREDHCPCHVSPLLVERAERVGAQRRVRDAFGQG
jgi:hypothetical protein